MTTKKMIAGQVQDKIPCLFETQFNEQTKENLATNKLRKELVELVNSFRESPTGSSEFSDSPLLPIVKTTVKMDGTCCLIRNGQLWKRFDKKLNRAGSEQNRKLQKLIREKQRENVELKFNVKKHYKNTPEGWIPADANLNVLEQEFHNSQHIVGWVPVSNVDRQDVWHASCLDNEWKHVYLLWCSDDTRDDRKLRVKKVPIDAPELQNGTFELVGPKINGNIYGFPVNHCHYLIGHGSIELPLNETRKFMDNVNDLTTVNRDRLIEWFSDEQNPFSKIEGIVWHVLHPETGQVLQMYKVHQHHLGLQWPKADSTTGILFSYQEEWSIQE